MCKKFSSWAAIFCLVLCLAWPAQTQADLQQADELYAEQDLHSLKQAIALYEEAVENDPGHYEANWKLARAYREYALFALRQNLKDWEAICSEYGQKGMERAEKAAEINPDEVHGHFFYGLSVSVYSESVGIVSAIREGLRSKTKDALEKAYEIDKHYQDSTPIMALGRYWQVVPWPYRDRDQALAYYREAQEAMPEDSRFRAELQVYLGSLLLEMGQHEQEAKELLIQAQEADRGYFDEYFQNKAQAVLEEHS